MPPTGASGPAVRVGSLSKRYPGVTALEDVTLEFPAAAVSGVIGENGAGKSTLMAILAGLVRPDGGSITVFGREVQDHTPHAMLDVHGIALVPQELVLCPDRTVAENVLLGIEPGKVPSRHRMATTVRSLLERLGTDLDPLRRAGDLGMAEQQLVVIARALARNSRIIILDEPTATLTPSETAWLLGLLRRLRDEGTTIIYVSHRLPEIYQICDQVSVLRDGHLIGTWQTTQTTHTTLVTAMVGRSLARVTARSAQRTRVLLRTRDLRGRTFSGVSLDVFGGEVLGIAGLPDSGRLEFLATLFGAERSSGSIEIEGSPADLRTPQSAIKAGIGYVPADRRHAGILATMNVAENLVPLITDRLGRFGFVRPGLLRREAAVLAQRFAVKGQIGQSVRQLSGGNQQKVILARWSSIDVKVLLLDEPTRGIDVATKADVHARLQQLADDGVAVIVSSSDMPELLTVCDRICVMWQGRVVGIVNQTDATEESLMSLMAGYGARAA